MAEEADIPALCRLRLAYFDEEFGDLPQEQLSAISAQLPAYFAEHLGRDCIVAAAESPEGVLVANAILMISEKPANPFFPNAAKDIFASLMLYIIRKNYTNVQNNRALRNNIDSKIAELAALALENSGN